ncbi:MAG: hypothetical protein QM811_24415 [Pirellulales bacterium]
MSAHLERKAGGRLLFLRVVLGFQFGHVGGQRIVALAQLGQFLFGRVRLRRIDGGRGRIRSYGRVGRIREKRFSGAHGGGEQHQAPAEDERRHFARQRRVRWSMCGGWSTLRHANVKQEREFADFVTRKLG